MTALVTLNWVNGGVAGVVSVPIVNVEASVCCDVTRMVGPGYWLL